MRASQGKGKAEIDYVGEFDVEAVQRAMVDEEQGYTVSPWGEQNSGPRRGLRNTSGDYLEITGGLLVAVAAKYNAAHAHLTDAADGCNAASSTSMPGGSCPTRCSAAPSARLGSALTLSPRRSTASSRIAASAVMVVLGLQMLRLFAIARPPAADAAEGRLPTASTTSAERETKGAAFLLGASTFLLPCGFTQALQLYVLAKGQLC